MRMVLPGECPTTIAAQRLTTLANHLQAKGLGVEGILITNFSTSGMEGSLQWGSPPTPARWFADGWCVCVVRRRAVVVVGHSRGKTIRVNVQCRLNRTTKTDNCSMLHQGSETERSERLL